MGTPYPESSSMRARRLFVLVAIAISPMFAACGALPTENDTPAATAPADSTMRKDSYPWG